jgi:hypothetical protein
MILRIKITPAADPRIQAKQPTQDHQLQLDALTAASCGTRAAAPGFNGRVKE